MKLLLNKLPLRLLSGVFIFALILSLFSPAIASAVDTPRAENITEANPDDQAKSNSYYRALRKCFRNNLHDSIQLTGADNGITPPSMWFNEFGWGYVYPEGKLDCKDIAPLALELWGYGKQYNSFLTDFGATYNNSTLKWTAPSDPDQRQNQFDATIQAKYYTTNFTGIPEQSGEARYVMFANVFDKACTARDLGKVTTITNSSYKKWVNSSSADKGTEVAQSLAKVDIPGIADDTYVYFSKVMVPEKSDNGIWKPVEHGFAYTASGSLVDKNWNKDSTSNALVRIYGYQGGGDMSTNRTCHEIQKGVNENVGAWILWATAHPTEDAKPPISDDLASLDSDTSKCQIEGIGWIVCPVVTFLANLADASFGFLADNFLRTEPKAFDTQSRTYEAWSVMRTIANVAFVLVFLIIIFSQLTSVGISNYGVKKLLPRLVISAILVNLSFFVCQIAVDLSNILGYSIKDVFSGIGTVVGGGNAQEAQDTLSPFADGDGFVGFAGGVLALAGGGVAFYALISTMVPVILAAVVALLMILFILIARQALVILLVVISPLAFVAFLLPNTEPLFKKWRQALTAMLLLFPIIALVFGASSLAADILNDTFSGNYDSSTVTTENWFGQIAAAAVMILPLFVVPTLLKKSLDGIPAIGQIANKISSRANSNIGKKAGESYRGSLAGRGAEYKKRAKESFRQTKYAERVSKGGASRFFAQGIGLGAANKAANESLVKSAVETQQKVMIEEISAAKAEIDSLNLTGEQKLKLAVEGKLEGVTNEGKKYSLSGDNTRRAAIQDLMATGSVEEIHSIVRATSEKGADGSPPSLAHLAQTVSMAAASSGVGSKDPALAGAQLGVIAQGEFSYTAAVKDAASKGKYTSEAFAGMDNTARARAIEVAEAAAKAGDSSIIDALRAAAQGVRASSEISGKISGNASATAAMDKLIGKAPVAPPPEPAAALPPPPDSRSPW